MSRTTIPRTVSFAVYLLAALSIALTCALLAIQGTSGWILAVIMLAITVAAGRLHGRLSFHATVSPDDLPLAMSVLVLEPRFAMAVGIVAGLLAKARFGWVSRALNLVVMAVPVGIASTAFVWATGSLGISDPRTGVVAWFALAISAILLMNIVHYSLHTAWSHAAHRKELFWSVALPLLKGDVVSAVLVACLVEAGLLLTGVAKAIPVVLAAVAFVGLWQVLRSSQRHVEAASHRDELNSAIFVSFARLLEMRDPETARHSARVAVISRDIARALDLSEQEQSRIHLAGLLHDVGKVGVPDEVLLKPGRLTDDERLAMEQHARLSAEALAGLPGFGELARMVYAHHERLDGSGYPEGVAGDEIGLGARILGVADTFEAITADRPYRVARDWRTALRILMDEDHLFDQQVVDALARSIADGATVAESGDEQLVDFAREWSRAGRHLGADLDEEPFVVPPDRPRQASPVPPSALLDTVQRTEPSVGPVRLG